MKSRIQLWNDKFTEQITKRIAEAEEKCVEQTQVITAQSQSAVIDFTSAKLVEMNTKLDSVTQQIGQLPAMMQEMRQMMAKATSPMNTVLGKRIRHHEQYAPGSQVQCLLI